MFTCVRCSGQFTLDAVKDGSYFPSMRMCLHCYQKMAKSDDTCFADKDLYDPEAIGCRMCPDKAICGIFVDHPHDSMRER